MRALLLGVPDVGFEALHGGKIKRFGSMQYKQNNLQHELEARGCRSFVPGLQRTRKVREAKVVRLGPGALMLELFFESGRRSLGTALSGPQPDPLLWGVVEDRVERNFILVTNQV